MCMWRARRSVSERHGQTAPLAHGSRLVNKTGSRAVCASAGIQITVLASRQSGDAEYGYFLLDFSLYKTPVIKRSLAVALHVRDILNRPERVRCAPCALCAVGCW